jgi:hypothetical protein
MMFDDSKRHSELKVLMNKVGIELLSPDWFRYQIISQEKSMIAQAKKEAREEFAEKIKQLYITPEIDNTDNIYLNIMNKILDKLLKEYEEE